METTVGQVLINEALPPELRDYSRVLDKRGLTKLLAEVAKNYPEQYPQVAKRLSDVGRWVATETGGYSFGLDDLRRPPKAQAFLARLRRKIKQIDKTVEDEDERNRRIVALLRSARKTLVNTVLEEAQQAGNPLAKQVVSGARGTPDSLNSLLGADLLYVDNNNREIPIPVLSSYAEGLTPAEYFAGAFGARRGSIDTKQATQDAGYLAKQLVQAAHRLVVTADDDPQGQSDPDAPRGYPVATDDPDNVGALLAVPVGKYPRNTILTPKILKELQDANITQILVRSPVVGGPAEGGVYAADVGVRERGVLPPRGDFVGIAAAQAIAEPLTQSQLSSKHTGGVSGAIAGAVTGFKAIDQMIQVPEVFAGGATHAQLDGTVRSIRRAPQGGHFVVIGDQEHYVPEALPVKVRVGQTVEAGDVISGGVPHPAEIVRHKGIGAGRAHFVSAFTDLLRNSGITVNRRNVELLARGLINHVALTEELDNWVPGDIVPYQSLERSWTPRPGVQEGPPQRFKNHYLERPVLHYTLGTRLTPTVLNELARFGVKRVAAHPEPPPFEPSMIRGAISVTYDPDWETRLLGGFQEDSLLEAARRGDVADETGTSFVPALARGEEFGRIGATAGWRPEDLAKRPRLR